jgi:hypothetical protein
VENLGPVIKGKLLEQKPKSDRRMVFPFHSS